MKTFAALAALLLATAASPATERVVTGDRIVTATIDGVPGRMRIDPGALGMPLITAVWAARAGLEPGIFAIGYGVGHTIISGRTAVTRIDTGTGAARHRIGWTRTPYAAGLDGVIGPGALSDSVVRFVLHAPRAGDRTMNLPMVDGGGLFGGFSGLFTTLDVDGEPMRVRFDPSHPRSLATAGAAARIAAARDGRLTGAVEPVEIAFGIERPVRTMTLARPIVIGPLAIATLGVRTADAGSAGSIPETGAPPPDPDEIVVIAKGKKRDRDRLSLGADVLDRCSSIVFDKPAKAIRLTCT